MSLLRRSSSKKSSNDKSDGANQDVRSSLFQRLSRRNSQDSVQGATPPTVIATPEQEVATTKPKPTRLPSPVASPTNGLSKEDVRALFFGAPHFMLEKGRHGKFASYPFTKVECLLHPLPVLSNYSEKDP